MSISIPPIRHYLPTMARDWAGVTGLTILYFLAGIIGLSVQTAYNGITPIWPASGIAFATLFLFGIRLWPGIVLAMTGLSLFADIPIHIALAAGFGSVLEATIPVLLLRHVKFDGNLNRLNNVLYFVAFAVFLGPLFSATAGTAAFAIARALEMDAIIKMWAFWWLGNSVGVLMVGSVILIYGKTPDKGAVNRISSGVLLVCLTVFASFCSMAINTFPYSTLILFFLFPLIIFAAMQLGLRWVSSIYLSALLTFIIAGALFFPQQFNTQEIDGVYLNITFLIFFTFLGLFAAAAQAEQLDKHILEYHASTDNLTGMMSRRAFLEQLSTSVRNLRRGADRHSLLYVDLDGLKIVNDSAGHATGDLVLKSITQIMLGIIRNQDIAGRLGGDEFAILLRNCESQAARTIAEKIRHAVSQYNICLKDHQYSVTTSIGIVDIDASRHNVATLLELADQACYASKRSGGDQVTLAESA